MTAQTALRSGAVSEKDENVAGQTDDTLGFEEDEFLREWEEADKAAVTLLREAIPEAVDAKAPTEELRGAAQRIRAGQADRPYRFAVGAAGWEGKPPGEDRDLWIQTAGALIAMNGESGLGNHEEASLMALEHADWAGAVIGLVRSGVGTRSWPEDLFRFADECPEIEGSYDPDDREAIEFGYELIVPVWEAIGALDEHRRLTALGSWGLPRALAWAWADDLDTTEA